MELVRRGLSDYEDLLEEQIRIQKEVKAGEREDALIVTRHNPVITLGKSASRDNLLASPKFIREQGMALKEVGRGGGVTYHGPGQLVLYPICDLRNFDKDLRSFVRDLEKVMKVTAEYFGLEVEVFSDSPGLWLKGQKKKLGSLGLSVKNWVTYHGLAFNVDLDREKSSLLNPCGMKDVSLVSLSDFAEVSIGKIRRILLKNFEQVFQVELNEVSDDPKT